MKGDYKGLMYYFGLSFFLFLTFYLQPVLCLYSACTLHAVTAVNFLCFSQFTFFSDGLRFHTFDIGITVLCATIAVQVKFLVKLWKLVNAIRSGVNFRSVGHLEDSQARKGSFWGRDSGQFSRTTDPFEGLLARQSGTVDFKKGFSNF